jgi:hypothetical protein
MGAILNALDPGLYSESAQSASQEGNVADISPDLLGVRIAIEISQGLHDAARLTLSELLKREPVGHLLFRARTAGLYLAAANGESEGMQAAVEAWLTDQARFPVNFETDVLKDPMLLESGIDIDLQALTEPGEAAAELTDADKMLIGDLEAVRTKAVAENMEWLVSWRPNFSRAEMARTYSLFAVNRELFEATLTSSDCLPDLIAAFDETWNFQSAFIAH